MQVQRVQNNYNQTFGAKVTILDVDNIIPKGIKRTFTKLCRDLGKDTDEIILDVFKANNKIKIGELETDVFRVNVMGAYDRNYIEAKFPVWTSREYSMPRNLANIYKNYILPVFENNNVIIKNLSDTAETRLLSAVAKSKN